MNYMPISALPEEKLTRFVGVDMGTSFYSPTKEYSLLAVALQDVAMRATVEADNQELGTVTHQLATVQVITQLGIEYLCLKYGIYLCHSDMDAGAAYFAFTCNTGQLIVIRLAKATSVNIECYSRVDTFIVDALTLKPQCRLTCKSFPGLDAILDYLSTITKNSISHRCLSIDYGALKMLPEMQLRGIDEQIS